MHMLSRSGPTFDVVEMQIVTKHATFRRVCSKNVS
jgi:hypothetical protein